MRSAKEREVAFRCPQEQHSTDLLQNPERSSATGQTQARCPKGAGCRERPHGLPPRQALREELSGALGRGAGMHGEQAAEAEREPEEGVGVGGGVDGFDPDSESCAGVLPHRAGTGTGQGPIRPRSAPRAASGSADTFARLPSLRASLPEAEHGPSCRRRQSSRCRRNVPLLREAVAAPLSVPLSPCRRHTVPKSGMSLAHLPDAADAGVSQRPVDSRLNVVKDVPCWIFTKEDA